MRPKVEPFQQPLRKVVGRPPTAGKRLAQLEEFNTLVQKYAHESNPRREGDYFPARKIVGRKS